MAVGVDVRVASTAVIKETTAVRRWLHEMPDEIISIGDHVAIDDFFYCTTQLKLGSYCHIGPHVSIIGGQQAKFRAHNFVALAAGARIICAGDKHQGAGIPIPWVPEEFRDEVYNSPVTLDDHVVVGTNAVVFPGVVMHEGSVLGAGSVLKHRAEPWTIYAGVPARPIKSRPKDKLLEFAKRMGF